MKELPATKKKKKTHTPQFGLNLCYARGNEDKHNHLIAYDFTFKIFTLLGKAISYTLNQYFSNFKVHTKPLEALLKHISGPFPPGILIQ